MRYEHVNGLRRVNEYYWEIEGNFWYKSSYPYTKALELAKTMVDCIGCYNSSYCTSCLRCIECTACNYCTDLQYETNVNNVVASDQVHNVLSI